MEVLLGTLLRLTGGFDPATSAQVLALVGTVALVFGFGYLLAHAGNSATQGVGHVLAGLQALILALVWLVAALLILWLTYCLVRGTLTHILH
jgi:hypothetical protein